MAGVTLDGISKIYPDGTRAVSSLDLDVRDGEFLVLVGPSGCGKTTALRIVAGLEAISEGELLIDDQVVNDLDPRRRDVAMIFQNYALYPHMSVFNNIAFPLHSRGTPKEQVKADVERAAAMLGLTELLKRRPRTLSGGQRQRVAMGRALVRRPRVFLMDEPLSNLDAKLRVQMRVEITRLQQDLGVTTVYVTHDQVEAMTMGSRIAVMRKGILQQVGPPEELYDAPRNLFTAGFIGSPGMNLFRARVERDGDSVACLLRDQRLTLPIDGSASRKLLAHIGREIALGIRPEHLSLASDDNHGSLDLHGQVTLVEALGSERLVHLEVDADAVLTEEVLEIARDTDAAAVEKLKSEAAGHRVPVVARLDPRASVHNGDAITLRVDADSLYFFDLEDGTNIGTNTETQLGANVG